VEPVVEQAHLSAVHMVCMESMSNFASIDLLLRCKGVSCAGRHEIDVLACVWMCQRGCRQRSSWSGDVAGRSALWTWSGLATAGSAHEVPSQLPRSLPREDAVAEIILGCEGEVFNRWPRGTSQGCVTRLWEHAVACYPTRGQGPLSIFLSLTGSTVERVKNVKYGVGTQRICMCCCCAAVAPACCALNVSTLLVAAHDHAWVLCRSN
jgi:hypothetical protein